MFKRAIITSIVLFVTIALLLYAGFSNTLIISKIFNLFGIERSPLILDVSIILLGTALVSYLLFCRARTIFSSNIHSVTSFSAQVWGLTVGYNMILVFMAFYFAGVAGLLLIVYFSVIYLCIGVFTLVDFCILNYLQKKNTKNNNDTHRNYL